MSASRRIPWIVAAAAALSAPTATAGAAPPTAQVIVDSERAFERAVVADGTRAGFRAFLADEAIVLQPRPVPGRAAVEAEPAPGAPLRWRPDLATISGRGEFGWASGPYLSFKTSADEPPLAVGHDLTAWRRTADGSWRVVLDGGIAYPFDDARARRQLEVTPRLRAPLSGRGRASDCSQAFADRWQQQGRTAALKEFLAADARQLAAGQDVVDGRGAWTERERLRGAVLTKLRPSRTLRSDGGDIEIGLGELDVAARLDAPAGHYHYVHVWDVGARCALALEMLNPVR